MAIKEKWGRIPFARLQRRRSRWRQPLRERVLVVDSEEPIREIIGSMLRHAVGSCQFASNGREALAILSSGEEFDVVATDVMMPEMDGIQLLERIRAERPGLPVLFVTAVHDCSTILGCFRSGAYDYLLKPFERKQLLAHVRRVLQMGRDEGDSHRLLGGLARITAVRTKELRERIRAFDMLDADPVTMLFLDDEAEYNRCCWGLGAMVVAIARAAGLSREEIQPMARATVLHSVGQHPSLRHLLLHPEILQADDLAVACQLSHEVHEILQSVSFLAEASETLYACGERFDGSGHPRGLRGPQIPLGARIFALAYTVLKLTAPSYPERERCPMASAHAKLQQRSATQLDPELVRLFMTIPEEVWKDLDKKLSWVQ